MKKRDSGDLPCDGVVGPDTIADIVAHVDPLAGDAQTQALRDTWRELLDDDPSTAFALSLLTIDHPDAQASSIAHFAAHPHALDRIAPLLRDDVRQKLYRHPPRSRHLRSRHG